MFVPSVQLALVLARSLETNVETLFYLVGVREKWWRRHGTREILTSPSQLVTQQNLQEIAYKKARISLH